MPPRLLLSTFLLASAAFGAEPLKNAVLTENLEHPPMLFRCMNGIFPFSVKYFLGPNLSADRLYVDYRVRSDGGIFTWRFRAAAGNRFRAFLYDVPSGNSAMGAFTPAMERNSEIVPPDRGRPPMLVDLTPCEGNLRSRKR